MKKRFYVTQYATILQNKKLLLLKNNGHTKVRGKWVFPGGHVNLEKDPIVSLKREVKEELGCNLIKADIFKTYIKKYHSGWRYVVYYKCSINKTKIKLSPEHSEYKWTSLKNIKGMKFRDDVEKQLIMQLLR